MTARSTQLLSIACFVMLAGIAAELALPNGTPLPVERVRVQPASNVLRPAAMGNAGEVATVLARPLFAEDRRPRAPGTAASAPGNSLPILTGIIIAEGDRRAVFSDFPGRPDRTVREGAEIGPYHIETITPASVTVSGPAGRQELRPSFRKVVGVEPQTPAPLSLPSAMPQAPDPGRFYTPGPLGLAIYQYSPAAPPPPKPPVPGFGGG